MLNQFNVESRGPYCVEITRDIPPCYNEPVIAQAFGSSAYLPLPDSKQWKGWWGITPILEVGNTYRIVVHTTPGWYSWNGEEWVENEAGAALQWWHSDATNPYPHGSAFFGCNIKDQDGSWSNMPNHDATFRLYQLCPSLPS